MVVTVPLEITIDFLTKNCSRTGWWNDFNTLAGYSDEWVTAYVAASLAETGLPQIRPIVEEAWQNLKDRRFWSKGWGYNRKVPKDTDSTIWALHLAEKTGNEKSFRARRAYKFICESINNNGGIPTYPDEGMIRVFTRLKRNFSFEGWCQPHTSVTAAAAALDHLTGNERLLQYLAKTQNEDGSWQCYWWCDDENATFHAVNAMKKAHTKQYTQRIIKAAGWVLERLTDGNCIKTEDLPGGSPFSTSLALQILLNSGDSSGNVTKTTIRSLAKWLLENRLNDGSWTSSARLRIPPPDEIYPENVKNWSRTTLGSRSIRTDQNRFFTTATVLNSLILYQKTLKT